MNNEIKNNLDALIANIKNTDGYIIYTDSKEKIIASNELNSLLYTYNEISKKIQKSALNGTEPNEEDVQKFTSISLLAFEHEEIVNYISQKIKIENAISELFKYICNELDIEI